MSSSPNPSKNESAVSTFLLTYSDQPFFAANSSLGDTSFLPEIASFGVDKERKSLLKSDAEDLSLLVRPEFILTVLVDSILFKSEL